MGAKYFGAAVKRREDPRFLRGEARYVDDVKLPGLLHAAFLRAPHAHARIRAIRTHRAATLPRVLAVFTEHGEGLVDHPRRAIVEGVHARLRWAAARIDSTIL